MSKWAKRKTIFKPTHSEIDSAVEDYLKRGGKIKKMEPDINVAGNLKIKGNLSEADEFLSGS